MTTRPFDPAANLNIDIAAEIAAARAELAAAGQPTDDLTVAHLFAWRWAMASEAAGRGFVRYPPGHQVRAAKVQRPIIAGVTGEDGQP